MTGNEIKTLGGIHDGLLKEWKNNVPVKPLFVYALDENYLSKEAENIISDNIGEIAAWKPGPQKDSSKIGRIAITLILYQIRRFYNNGNGGDFWNCLEGVNNARNSPFGYILGIGDHTDITRDYLNKYVFNEELLKSLGVHDEQLGYEANDYFDFFRYNCPFLKADERGNQAARLRNNSEIFSKYLEETSLMQDSWDDVCERDSALFEECKQIANSIIEIECDDKPECTDGKLYPIISDTPYIHTLLKYAPEEYFLSLKALRSEESDSGKDNALEKWPWLKGLWGHAVGKFDPDLSWQPYSAKAGELDFLLHAKMKRSVILKQGDFQREFYRPQIFLSELREYGFDPSQEIAVYAVNSEQHKIADVPPLPDRAAYLLPEHPNNKAEKYRNLCESKETQPEHYRKRLYLISRSYKKMEPLRNGVGDVLQPSDKPVRLEGYEVSEYILDEPNQLETMVFYWGDNPMYIHMPAKPEIPESNGWDDIERCRCDGASNSLPFCVQAISAEDIDTVWEEPYDVALINLLSPQGDKLPYMSYTAPLQSDLDLLCEIEEKAERKERRLANGVDIYPRKGGYLIERFVNRRRSHERYFISRKLPNFVTVKCRLNIEDGTPLDRKRDCVLLPKDWRNDAQLADVTKRLKAARIYNDCYELNVGGKNVTLECKLKEQAAFILKDMVTPVDGCAGNGGSTLDCLSVHYFPCNSDTEALGIERTRFELRWAGEKREVHPRQGQDLQSLFCENGVPMWQPCELWQGETTQLFSGQFIPQGVCVTKEAIFIPDGYDVRTVKLYHENNIIAEKALCEDAETLHNIAAPCQGGRTIAMQILKETCFPEAIQEAGWYRILLIWSNGSESDTRFFWGRSREIPREIIESFGMFPKAYEKWPELTKELQALETAAANEAGTASQPNAEAPSANQMKYHLYAEFVASFEMNEGGYINREGRYTSNGCDKLPLARLFQIDGSLITDYRWNEDGFSYQTGRQWRWQNYRYDSQGKVIGRDFEFSIHQSDLWFERTINGDETVFPMVERWLKLAQNKLQNLQYEDILHLGQTIAPNANWLQRGNLKTIEGGVSLMFQIVKKLFEERQNAQASLLLLAIYLVMRDRGQDQRAYDLPRRTHALERVLSQEERTAVSQCMNLTYWLFIHF